MINCLSGIMGEVVKVTQGGSIQRMCMHPCVSSSSYCDRGRRWCPRAMVCRSPLPGVGMVMVRALSSKRHTFIGGCVLTGP
jgi:hypothetical protein